MTDNEVFKFDKLTVKDGLCHSSVYTILQDKKGFMWFGTFYGISKYDGYKFKSYYTMKNSISFEEKSVSGIFSSFEDSNGDIWFGSWNGELIKYSKEEDNIEYYTIPLKENIFRNIIYFICEDILGYLWIGTSKCGLYKFDKFTNEFFYKNFKWDGKNVDSTAGIANINESELILLKRNELIIYNMYNEKSELININYSSEIPILQKFYRIFKISNFEYVLFTVYGLMIYDVRTNEINKFNINFLHEKPPTLDIISMSSDYFGNIWFSLKNGGIFKIDKYSKKAIDVSNIFGSEFGISSNRVFSICFDKSGVIWISLLESGLFKSDINKKNFTHILLSDSMNSKIKNIFKLYYKKTDTLLVGTRNHGIINYNVKTNISFQYKTSKIKEDCLSTQLIVDIFKDNQNTLWAVTDEGIYKYLNKEDKFDLFLKLGISEQSRIICISDYFEANKHYLIIGLTSKKGITRIDTIDKTISSFPDFYNTIPELNYNFITLLYTDKKNNLWVSTKSGLYKLSLKNNSCVNFSNEIRVVNKIYEDSKNDLWLCGRGIIYKYIDKNNLFEKYPIPLDGNKIISDILDDTVGNIWFSTLRAIYKMNPNNKKFTKYDHFDGLINEEYKSPQFCKDDKGIIYSGGTDGIDCFNPAEIKDNPYIPNIVITDFEISNKSVYGSRDNQYLKKNITYADEINLTYRENIFSFTFASLVYNRSQKNQYSYKMEGFDKDWTYSGTRRRVTYTNLDPGEYIFRVKGSNNDGVWNEEGTSIKINISPPFWKTWWFKGLSIIGTTALTGYGINQRFEKIKKEKKLQEDFSRKLIESQENDRKRIASELHDSLGQDLAVIKNKAIMSMKKASDKKFKEQMSEISEITTNAMNEVKEISYNLRPYELDRLGLIKTLKSLVERAGKTSNINFTCDIDNIDKIFDPEVEINIYRIIQECLTNIIKHSNATEVSVYLKKLSNNVTIFISDNGKGFDINKIYSKSERIGFGLRGIPERVKLFGGNFKIESEPGMGTKINISIPVLN